jgi:hypothetical protein
MKPMHFNEQWSQIKTIRNDHEADGEFARENLVRWLCNAVAVLREEVPREAWPRVAARLQAAGLAVPVSDDDPNLRSRRSSRSVHEVPRLMRGN